MDSSKCVQCLSVTNITCVISAPERARTDFPTPTMTVNCLSDGVQVDIMMQGYSSNGSEFNGLLYVKGHSKDSNCRKPIPYEDGPVDFKVKFGTCGLEHKDVR